MKKTEANFLQRLGTEGKDNPNLTKLIEMEDIALPLAFMFDFEYAVPTQKGIDEMERLYKYLKTVAKEQGLKDIEDLIYTDSIVEPQVAKIVLKDNQFKLSY